MRLRPLSHPSWHISISLTKWSAKLRVPLASSLQTVSCVIVVGDGVPEDIVCLILAHRFNGGATIGITKPQTEWDDAVTKIVSSTRTNTIALIIDQDNVELSELWNRIEDKLKEHAVSYERKVEEERFHAYDCKHGQYSFRFPVVINGLNKPYRKHTIEDHLLEASKVLNDEELRKAIKEIEDPKEAWRKLKDKHHKIYSYLLHEAEINLIMEAFPQHIKLFEFIKGHSINIH